MHSHLGRCFTYNFSADGYTRGEARVSGMFRSRSIWPFSRVPNLGYSKFWSQFFSFKLQVVRSFQKTVSIQWTLCERPPPRRLWSWRLLKGTFPKLPVVVLFVAGVRSQEGKPKVGLLLEKLVEKLKVASFFFAGIKYIWMIWSFVDLKIGWMGLKWISVYRFNVLGFLGGVFKGREPQDS